MRTEESVPLPDGDTLGATLATPDGEPPEGGWPAVVVVHEMYGSTPEMRDVTDRFASHGYVAALPSFYDHGNRAACVARAMIDSTLARPGPLVDDIEAARGWLAGRLEVDAQRLAVVGFCLGGGFALLHAARGPDGVRAAAVNYGAVPGKAEALANVCPVVASYGARDKIYGPLANKLERHLDAVGVPHDVKSYPDAGHSFMTEGDHPAAKLLMLPLRIGYESESAADAWARLFAFFDAHVKGG